MTTEQLELTLSRIQDWIRAADQKASIFLALILGSLAVGGNTLAEYIIYIFSVEQPLIVALLLLSTVILTWSIMKTLFIIKPSVANNVKSFTYFGHIAQLSLDEFSDLISKVTNKKYSNELLEQIHTSSKIARKKHRQLAEAIKLFCIFLVLLTLTLWFTNVA